MDDSQNTILQQPLSHEQLSPGTLLDGGHYKIEKVLGQGGFGITYLATDLKLDIKVAIKEFFPASLCTREKGSDTVYPSTQTNAVTVDKLRNKFFKEAQNIARLQSPYIVHILGVFEQNRTAYYVMDYLDGGTLAQLVADNGPLSPQYATEIISKTGNALEYIHSQKINHLDVKPANIMLRKTDNSPVLLDFGLSKRYDAHGNQTSTTPVGISQGYAPIEQYNQNGVTEFSPRTDLYSLAATYYFLLTGITPPAAASLLEYDLSFPSSFPQSLKAPILKAMAANRKNRHESVAAFVSEINKCCRSLQTQSGADKPRTGKKHKSGYIILLLVCLIIGGAVAYFISEQGKYKETEDTEKVTVIANEEQEIPITSESQDMIYTDSAEPIAEITDEADTYDAYGASNYFTEIARNSGSVNAITYNGNFIDSDGNAYPIRLTFDLNSSYLPTGCRYLNVDYGNGYEIPMQVQFDGDNMLVYGDVGGSRFEIRQQPNGDGYWRGTAYHGGKSLTAAIWPL